MIYYLFVIFAAAIILIYLIGLYYFFKQNYDNFFVGLAIGKNNLILIKSNKLNEAKNKKIKCMLTISTILSIVLYLLMIYFLKSDYDILKISVIILMYIVIFGQKKYIEKINRIQ